MIRSVARCALALVLAAPAARAQCRDGSPPPCSQAAPAMSVAVLTFQSRSRDTNDVFLAEGLADDIATRLSQVTRIIVRSREFARLAERDTVGANAYLDRLLRTPTPRRAELAVLLARVGRRSEAAEAVRTWPEPEANTWHGLRSAAYDPIRDYPEFQAFMARARERTFWTARPR